MSLADDRSWLKLARMSSVLAKFRWLAAAILLIAFSSVPDVAFAHGGHHSGHQASVTSSAFVTTTVVELHVQVATESGQAKLSRDCSSFCCLGAGAFCCNGAILSEGSNFPTFRDRILSFVRRNDRTPPSLSSEALPEPPRSFA